MFVTLYYGEAVDENGEIVLKVAIEILSEEFRWACGSSNNILRGEEASDIDVLKKYIKDLKDNGLYKDAKSLICIGTASKEGQRSREEKRARNRAERLTNLLYTTLSGSFNKPIYPMNFGQCLTDLKDKGCTDKTLDQRRIIVVKTVCERQGLTIEELELALIQIFEKKSQDKRLAFPIDITQYSLYQTQDESMLGYGKNMQEIVGTD